MSRPNDAGVGLVLGCGAGSAFGTLFGSGGLLVGAGVGTIAGLLIGAAVDHVRASDERLR